MGEAIEVCKDEEEGEDLRGLEGGQVLGWGRERPEEGMWGKERRRNTTLTKVEWLGKEP